MNIQKASQCFGVLLFLTLVTGCTQSTESTKTSSPTAPVLLFSASPTGTMPPILTPTATGTPTPAFTPTAVPTLPAEDARKSLLELLANNGGCRLPCLWGITPGKSSNQEARSVLMPLSSISAAETTYFEPAKLRGVLLGTISPLYIEGELRLNTWVAYLYEDDGIVTSIGFDALEESLDKKDEYENQIKTPIYDSPTFGKRVAYYSLSHVLSDQGIPDSVMIYIPRVEGYPIVAGVLEMVLLYPEQGIWIKYAMSMHNNGNVIKGCPANAHIEMELYPPGNPESFFSLLEKTDWGIVKGGYRPLEEVTSMSVEQLYGIFQNSTDKCIETPTNLWPTPER